MKMMFGFFLLAPIRDTHKQNKTVSRLFIYLVDINELTGVKQHEAEVRQATRARIHLVRL